MRDRYADRIVRLERIVAAMLETELDGGGGSEFYYRAKDKEVDRHRRKELWRVLNELHEDIERHSQTGQI